ncbi:MAG: DNA repair protein RecN [Armatimonadota bacterium]
MLVELRIQDFAVVEAATVEFGPGLNVLTGETGAGKSIIVDALTAVLGARMTTDVIRTGAASARVEARFEVADTQPAARWLRDQGLDARELVVGREIVAEGRTRAWINGRPVTIGMLHDLGDLLVEVTGQHEGQRLLRPAAHLDLLDAFGGPSLQALRGEVAERIQKRTVLRDDLETLIASERERQRQIEMLTHQIHEIDAARLQPDEEGALTARRTRLANAERLTAAAQAAYAALYEAEGQAASDQLGRARSALREGAALDQALAQAAERIDAVVAEAADIAHGLVRYAASIEARPDELAAVDDRLELVRSLRRKYGDTVDAILAFREEAAQTLTKLEGSVARSAEAAAAIGPLERELAQRCVRLSSLRQEAAARLERDIEPNLGALEMGRARLTVALTRETDAEGLPIGDERVAVGPTGADRAEFLFAPNPGEAPKPLARIASGGELSRLMLAIRHALSEAGAVPVLVCDEVDAGVGGRTAGAVGNLLDAVSRRRQVLCVSHLPLIASLADRHFWVIKEINAGRTRVRIQPLEAKARVEEIARMLSGKMPTALAREYAVELLGRARRQRGVGAVVKNTRGGKL